MASNRSISIGSFVTVLLALVVYSAVHEGRGAQLWGQIAVPPEFQAITCSGSTPVCPLGAGAQWACLDMTTDGKYTPVAPSDIVCLAARTPACNSSVLGPGTWRPYCSTERVDVKINGQDGTVVVAPGTVVTVTWTSTGMDSCNTGNSLTPWGPNVSKGTSGSQQFTATQSMTLGLQCQKNGSNMIVQDPTSALSVQGTGACANAQKYEYMLTAINTGLYSTTSGVSGGTSPGCPATMPGGWNQTDALGVFYANPYNGAYVCMFQRASTTGYNYTITSAEGATPQDIVDCSQGTGNGFSEPVPAGYTLASKICIVPNDSGNGTLNGCNSDLCLWKKAAAIPAQLGLQVHSTDIHTQAVANCTNSLPAGVQYAARCLFSKTSAPYHCDSQLCLYDTCGAVTGGVAGGVSGGVGNASSGGPSSANASSGVGICIPVCGDGVVDAGEECDDGNQVNGDGCSRICVLDGANASSGNGSSQSNMSSRQSSSTSGNGTSGASSSGANSGGSNSSSSNSALRPPAVCGNGIKEGAEECDDGNTLRGDGCDACYLEQCSINPPAPPSCSMQTFDTQSILKSCSFVNIAGVQHYQCQAFVHFFNLSADKRVRGVYQWDLTTDNGFGQAGRQCGTATVTTYVDEVLQRTFFDQLNDSTVSPGRTFFDLDLTAGQHVVGIETDLNLSGCTAPLPQVWKGTVNLQALTCSGGASTSSASSFAMTQCPLGFTAYYNGGAAGCPVVNPGCANMVTGPTYQGTFCQMACYQCPASTTPTSSCGDGVCTSADVVNCPADCSAPATCNNGVCDANENTYNCAVDCPRCGDGICNVAVGETASSCVHDCSCRDTDGFEDILTPGVVDDASTQPPLADVCVGVPNASVSVREYRCSGSSNAWVDYVCPSGKSCVNGACTGPMIMTPLAGCTDTDGGFAIGTKGTATTSISRADTCIWGNAFLVEYYCTNYGVIGSNAVQCPAGTVCRSGACVP